MLKDFTKKLLSIEEFAEYYNSQNGTLVKIGRNGMFRLLRELGILKEDNRPYVEYAKYFEVKKVLKYINGESRYVSVPLITFTGKDVVYSEIKRCLGVAK